MMMIIIIVMMSITIIVKYISSAMTACVPAKMAEIRVVRAPTQRFG